MHKLLSASVESAAKRSDAKRKATAELPEQFCDALTNELMTHPVRLPSGNYIDQSSLSELEGKDPYSRKALPSELPVDKALQKKIEHYATQNNIVLKGLQKHKKATDLYPNLISGIHAPSPLDQTVLDVLNRLVERDPSAGILDGQIHIAIKSTSGDTTTYELTAAYKQHQLVVQRTVDRITFIQHLNTEYERLKDKVMYQENHLSGAPLEELLGAIQNLTGQLYDDAATKDNPTYRQISTNRPDDPCDSHPALQKLIRYQSFKYRIPAATVATQLQHHLLSYLGQEVPLPEQVCAFFRGS